MTKDKPIQIDKPRDMIIIEKIERTRHQEKELLPSMEINQVICGDCNKLMKGIPSESIDMVLTSPPYDNLRDYSLDKFVVWRYTVLYDDKQKIIKELQERGIEPVSPSK